jgi:hypothetical protein
MRLTLLGIIFALILTLANAYVYRKNVKFAIAHDYAPLQLTQRRETHYEWDMFIWREIGAIIVTSVLFGIIASTGRRPPRRTPPVTPS